MVAKKLFNMDMLTDVTMTSLFQLAEYVCIKTSCNKRTVPLLHEPPSALAAPTKASTQQEITPTIRFSDQDRMVEGELFK